MSDNLQICWNGITTLCNLPSPGIAKIFVNGAMVEWAKQQYKKMRPEADIWPIRKGFMGRLGSVDIYLEPDQDLPYEIEWENGDDDEDSEEN